ncbi:hypothetical protein [uncultured Xanthomonas sp.]|nr:hypothetical protein [uncultured Xanthomonas sp.]
MSEQGSKMTAAAVRIGQALFLISTVGAFVTAAVMLFLPFTS